MKFKLPKKHQKNLQEKINEQGGFGNLPNVRSWIDGSTTELFNTGSVQLGWVNQEDINNVELVKFTKEPIDKDNELSKGTTFIHCENQNNEEGYIIVAPNETKNNFEFSIAQREDSKFMYRVFFHSMEMGLLDSITTKLHKDLVATA